MPSIEPFRGLRYNSRRVGSLARLVTPPYDVISPRQQEMYYRRHPFNFIRVVYGKTRDPYSEARAHLARWMRDGILERDPEPGIYPYMQEYRLGGRTHRRLGVIALVRLDARVYPHERIFGGPRKNRFDLMKAVNASLDPIFGLVPDPDRRYRKALQQLCRARKPAVSFLFQGVRHRLWRIEDPSSIRKVQHLLRSKKLVIADGHHRFEAARAYCEERRKRDPRWHRDAPCNFVMFYLSATGADEPGLLPTHRLVKVRPEARLKKMLEGAQQQGIARPVPSRRELVKRLDRLRSRRRLGVGLYTGNGAGVLFQPRAVPGGRLDVEWLQHDLLEKKLGTSRVEVAYTQDLGSAYRSVRRCAADAVFVMQTPRLGDVFRRALTGRRMPRKTTYFYPKILSGLVEYPFQD